MARRCSGEPRRRARDLKMWFAVDTLEYLRRGGRIGAAPAWLGLGAEDQADPHDRPRDHADRASAHRAPRRSQRLIEYAAGTPRATAPTAGSSSTSRRPTRRQQLIERGARDHGREPRVHLRDRPGHRRARRARAARRRRRCRLSHLALAAAVQARLRRRDLRCWARCDACRQRPPVLAQGSGSRRDRDRQQRAEHAQQRRAEQHRVEHDQWCTLHRRATGSAAA